MTMTIPDDRHAFRRDISPGLAVVVDESLCIVLLSEQENHVLKSHTVSNVAALQQALGDARDWVAVREAVLADTETARRWRAEKAERARREAVVEGWAYAVPPLPERIVWQITDYLDRNGPAPDGYVLRDQATRLPDPLAGVYDGTAPPPFGGDRGCRT